MYSGRTRMQIYKKKSRNYSVKLFKFSIIGFVLAIGLLGCYKRKDTTLRVVVYDSAGLIVEGANVDMFAEPTDTSNQNPVSLYSSISTDKFGIAIFNLNANYESGQSGVAILKVRASYYNKQGESTIQIIEEVVNECNLQIE
ncbi:MAG: hypothetical protein FJZ67_07540 [Bacteroidetes bacterium]|nr:hypothetical protein [Bacteroidota bacterium]